MTANALRVKMHDKHGPLVSIGKHLGMFVDQVQVRARYAIATSQCRPRSGKSSTSRKADERCVLGLAKRRALGQVRFGFGNSGASRPIPNSTSQLIMRTYPDARLRADARGRDGGVREELAQRVACQTAFMVPGGCGRHWQSPCWWCS